MSELFRALTMLVCTGISKRGIAYAVFPKLDWPQIPFFMELKSNPLNTL